MLIIGHRGAKGLAPENSLEAIKKALEVKADAIEIDVRLHGNQPVLSHDPVLKQGAPAALKDALKLIDGKVPVFLEIKEHAVVTKLVKLMRTYHGTVTYSSKKYDKLDILKDIKQQIPDAHLAVTEGWSSLRAIALATVLETNEIHLNHQWLWGSYVRSMKYRGFDVYAYTVNSNERAEELAEWGVNGIFTDYPDRIRA
jgi:glycerophosphoryl diester phosphodiesterase